MLIFCNNFYRYQSRIYEIRDHEWDFRKFLAQNTSETCLTSFYNNTHRTLSRVIPIKKYKSRAVAGKPHEAV